MITATSFFFGMCTEVSCVADAPPLAPTAPTTCDACGIAYSTVKGYPENGCISADGYWRAVCPVTGSPPIYPEKLCISAACASTAPTSTHLKYAGVSGDESLTPFCNVLMSPFGMIVVPWRSNLF